MKKLFILPVIVLLSACGMFQTEPDNTNGWKAERNTDCSDVRAIRVFQTLSSWSALARICENGSTSYCYGTVVLLEKDGEDLWDDKIVKPGQDKCFVYDGTYKYETKGNDTKTVPVLKTRYKYSPKSIEEFRERALESATQEYLTCAGLLDDAKNEKIRSDWRGYCLCRYGSVDTIFNEISASTDMELTQENILIAYATKWNENHERCKKEHPKIMKYLTETK